MNRMRYTIWFIFVILMAVMLLPSNIFAQGDITVTSDAWEAEFRDHLTFRLEAESSSEIVEADLFYQISGQIATSRNETEFTPGTAINAEFVIDQTDPSNYSPPGTEMIYWWKLVDADGNELKTEKQTLLYLDNRYDWRTLQNDRVTLYWYNGSDQFGQDLFDRANTALDTLESDVGALIENPIKIFIYGNHDDLLGALRTSAQEWTGGVAFTEFGVVVLGITPQQLDWGLNAMTHEMTHLVIHQATDNPFGDLPRWLDEGIAVYNEDRDELDQDFGPIFDRAVRNDELMTLRTLSSPFPADPLQANLAYGHSGEVVRYIIDTYGSDAMAELLAVFAEGALYDEALEQVLGVDTDRLDNDFRASIGLPPLPGTETAEEEAVVIEEESAEAEAEVEESMESVEAEPTAAPAADEEEVAVIEVDSSASESAEAEVAEPQTSNTPGGFSCSIGGALPLILLGIVLTRRRWQFLF